MMPPRPLIFVGGGDFEQIGNEYKNHFVNLGSLQPHSRVLDVGSGIGRMAIPLTGYLSSDGEYWGFDIVTQGISWCQRRISSKYDNFHFIYSDVLNKHYNRKGKIPADKYRFPFDSEYFDFVFLTSVFTHMLSSAMENYLREVSRVLRTGNKCFITLFLLNEESEGLIRSGRSSLDFRYEIDNGLTVNKNVPEGAVAYNEDYIIRLFEQCGLRINPPIHYGCWCNRKTFLSYQDIIVATKG